MRPSNGGLPGKYHNMKVTKCEVQCSKTFEKVIEKHL